MKRRTTYKATPKFWGIISTVMFVSAFAVMAYRFWAGMPLFDGLFLLGMVLFGIGGVCVMLQIDERR